MKTIKMLSVDHEDLFPLCFGRVICAKIEMPLYIKETRADKNIQLSMNSRFLVHLWPLYQNKINFSAKDSTPRHQ